MTLSNLLTRDYDKNKIKKSKTLTSKHKMFANNLTKLLQPKVRVVFNKGFPALLNSICVILMSKLFLQKTNTVLSSLDSPMMIPTPYYIRYKVKVCIQ